MESSDSGQEPLMSSCEHGDKTLGFKKRRELLEQLRDYQLSKDSAPQSQLLCYTMYNTFYNNWYITSYCRGLAGAVSMAPLSPVDLWVLHCVARW